MATSAYLYPYDPSGVAASNLIVSENHTVQPPNNISDASFIIPRAAPFFGESIIIRTGPTEGSTRLEEGVDYYLTHNFVTLSYLLARPIYGSITFINRNFSGDVFITYQTVGGEYVLDSYSIIEERTRSLYSVFMVTWEQVSGNFPQLPPYDHKMAGDDVVGFGAMVDSVNNLSAAVANGGSGTGGGTGGDGSYAALQAHINANTAHSKSQVGLANVDNYKTANEADVVSLSTRTFMTPAMTKHYLENTVYVTQLQTARQDITLIKTDLTDNENKTTQNTDAISVVNQSLTLIAENQDTLRTDLDNLVDDVATALSPFENVPSTVERHTTEITDLLNRVGLLETANTTHAADIADANNKLDVLQLSVDKLSTLLKFVPRVITPVDNLVFSVAPGRKIRIVLVAIENHTTDTVTVCKLYQLTNSKGVRRSNASIATLTPMLTVGSNKATANVVGEVNGFTYTAGTVTAAAGVTYTNKTIVSGRVPNPVDDEYGDTIQKISDLVINTTSYIVSADAVYNKATPLGVPSTGMAEMTYENTGAFDVSFLISGTFLVAAIQDVTGDPLPADLPITITYPT